MNPTTTYKLITRIEDLRLDKFIDCMCDQSLSVLVISGTPAPADLLEAWSNLYSQYLDILDDSETLYMLHLQRDVELLQFKIVTTEAIIRVLDFFHVEQLVDQLKGFGWNCSKLTMGNPGYTQALKVILSKLAPLKLNLKSKTDELIDYYKDKTQDTISRQFFAKQLSRLSKYQGYPIRPKQTMVPEYVAVLKDYLNINTKQPKDNGEEG
jgi:hypothetical protein